MIELIYTILNFDLVEMSPYHLSLSLSLHFHLPERTHFQIAHPVAFALVYSALLF